MRSVTSSSSGCAFTPSASSCAAAFLPRLSSRLPISTTEAFAPRPRAISKPIPLLAPVTSAIAFGKICCSAMRFSTYSSARNFFSDGLERRGRQARQRSTRLGQRAELSDHDVPGRVDVYSLAADPDGSKGVVRIVGSEPPLIAVARVECGGSGGFMHPGLVDDPALAQLPIVHGHQAKTRVVSKRRVKATEGADFRLILAFIKERIALRADLLPKLLFGILIEWPARDLFQNQAEHLRVDTLIMEFSAWLLLLL